MSRILFFFCLCSSVGYCESFDWISPNPVDYTLLSSGSLGQFFQIAPGGAPVLHLPGDAWSSKEPGRTWPALQMPAALSPYPQLGGKSGLTVLVNALPAPAPQNSSEPPPLAVPPPISPVVVALPAYRPICSEGAVSGWDPESYLDIENALQGASNLGEFDAPAIGEFVLRWKYRPQFPFQSVRIVPPHNEEQPNIFGRGAYYWGQLCDKELSVEAHVGTYLILFYPEGSDLPSHFLRLLAGNFSYSGRPFPNTEDCNVHSTERSAVKTLAGATNFISFKTDEDPFIVVTEYFAEYRQAASFSEFLQKIDEDPANGLNILLASHGWVSALYTLGDSQRDDKFTDELENEPQAAKIAAIKKKWMDDRIPKLSRGQFLGCCMAKNFPNPYNRGTKHVLNALASLFSWSKQKGDQQSVHQPSVLAYDRPVMYAYTFEVKNGRKVYETKIEVPEPFTLREVFAPVRTEWGGDASWMYNALGYDLRFVQKGPWPNHNCVSLNPKHRLFSHWEASQLCADLPGLEWKFLLTDPTAPDLQANDCLPFRPVSRDELRPLGLRDDEPVPWEKAYLCVKKDSGPKLRFARRPVQPALREKCIQLIHYGDVTEGTRSTWFCAK